jgi:selenocysteine lyase/cysteine desulfurase
MGAAAITEAGRERLSPSWGGNLTFETFESTGTVVRWPDARRFESSNFHRPSIVGMARSIGWLSMFVGLDWVYGRGASMTRLAADRLAGIEGVHVLTPPDRMANLVSFRIAGWDPEAALAELSSRVFAIARTVPLIDALRISVACFTTEAELERFAAAVELLAAHTPTTIPQRRTLTILSGG